MTPSATLSPTPLPAPGAIRIDGTTISWDPVEGATNYVVFWRKYVRRDASEEDSANEGQESQASARQKSSASAGQQLRDVPISDPTAPLTVADIVEIVDEGSLVVHASLHSYRLPEGFFDNVRPEEGIVAVAVGSQNTNGEHRFGNTLVIPMENLFTNPTESDVNNQGGEGESLPLVPPVVADSTPPSPQPSGNGFPTRPVSTATPDPVRILVGELIDETLSSCPRFLQEGGFDFQALVECMSDIYDALKSVETPTPSPSPIGTAIGTPDTPVPATVSLAPTTPVTTMVPDRAPTATTPFSGFKVNFKETRRKIVDSLCWVEERSCYRICGSFSCKPPVCNANWDIIEYCSETATPQPAPTRRPRPRPTSRPATAVPPTDVPPTDVPPTDVPCGAVAVTYFQEQTQTNGFQCWREQRSCTKTCWESSCSKSGCWNFGQNCSDWAHSGSCVGPHSFP